MNNCDLLIIGSGIAGLVIAIKTAEYSPQKNIILVTKADKSESNTKYAQGGLAVVMDKGDSFEKHIEDTLMAGGHLNDASMVNLVIKKGPKRLAELIEWGTAFDRDRKGELKLGMEGGHSNHRIVHHKDITGLEIEKSLIRKVNSLANITILQHHFAIDLITNHHLENNNRENVCFGAYVLDSKSQKIVPISAAKTCIATGGIGQVYRYNTNPIIATGDGIAMAYRAKAKVSNMEFTQFHPTALYEPAKSPVFLISEAVRGKGAYLINEKYERFMSHYDKNLELATRDVVSRAIDNELKKSSSNHIYLDITHLDQDSFKLNFPNIYKKCIDVGIDPSKDYIPVVPAMHYLCGGIDVNKNGKTSLKNLYACGECTNTGLHGANRLASNSLLEALVFSHRIAKHIKKSKTIFSPTSLPKWSEKGVKIPSELVLIRQNKEEIAQLMSNYVAIVRSNERLKSALDRINIIYNETENFYKKSKISASLGELRNIVTIAYLIVTQSVRRKENIGTFYNIDLETK